MTEHEDTSPSWLDNTFVETFLRNATNNPGLIVDKLEVTAAVDKGVNYASELQRVAVDCHDTASHFRRHFVVKSMPKAEVVRELLTDCGTFERETRMYERTMPDLREILGENFGELAAKTYPSQRLDTIVMEDLTAEGYKMVARRSDGLDYEHCELVLKALARLHASSLIYLKRNPSVVEEYKEKFYTPEFLPMTTAIFEPMFTKLIAEVATWPGYEHYSSKIRDALNISNIIELVKLRPEESLVLNHGDPWLNNTLFHYTTADSVDAVKFVDFQEVRLGSPTLDLQYFYCTSPSVDVRQPDTWATLLAVYHDEYCNVLKMSGESELLLDDMKSTTELKRKFDERSLFGLMAAGTSLPLIFLNSEEALDIDEMVKDEGDGDDKVGSMYTTKEFAEAFRKLLAYFDETPVWKK